MARPGFGLATLGFGILLALAAARAEDEAAAPDSLGLEIRAALRELGREVDDVSPARLGAVTGTPPEAAVIVRDAIRRARGAMPAAEMLAPETATVGGEYRIEKRGERLVIHLRLVYRDGEELFKSSPRVAFLEKLPEAPRELLFNLPGGVPLELVPIEPGTFTMGAADDPDASAFEMPAREVKITKGFAIGRYEVTQEQYRAVTGKNPSWHQPGNPKLKNGFPFSDQRPVEMVNHREAADFCDKLTELLKPANARFALPTEAQWEYACRAGTKEPYALGKKLNGKLANYVASRFDAPIPVGQLRQPNPWGLYDVHGNVWEWVADDYRKYDPENREDPFAAHDAAGEKKFQPVVRGGGYSSPSEYCRSSHRGHYVERDKLPYVGFRVVLVPAN